MRRVRLGAYFQLFEWRRSDNDYACGVVTKLIRTVNEGDIEQIVEYLNRYSSVQFRLADGGISTRIDQSEFVGEVVLTDLSTSIRSLQSDRTFGNRDWFVGRWTALIQARTAPDKLSEGIFVKGALSSNSDASGNKSIFIAIEEVASVPKLNSRQQCRLSRMLLKSMILNRRRVTSRKLMTNDVECHWSLFGNSVGIDNAIEIENRFKSTFPDARLVILNSCMEPDGLLRFSFSATQQMRLRDLPVIMIPVDLTGTLKIEVFGDKVSRFWITIDVPKVDGAGDGSHPDE